MEFDQYARQWDTEMRINRAKDVAAEIKRTIKTGKTYRALEFGCGTGLVSFNLIRDYGVLHLADVSSEMLKVVECKKKALGVDNIKGIQLDLAVADSYDNTYDVIYSSMVLHHIQDIDKICKYLYTMLNKDGELCIVDIDKDDGSFHAKYPEFKGHNGFDHDHISLVMEKAGFKDVAVRTFYHGEKEHNGQKIKYSFFILKAVKR